MTTPVNGIYVLQGVVPSQIATAPVGVKVVDLYDDNGNLFSTSQVAQMESGGGEVLGYFSIGEAENFRSYFSTLPSSIVGPVDPDWPGDYQVAYWTPQWLTVSENYIQTMINQGYNGAFFDVVGEAEQSWAIKNVPGGTLAAAEGAMVTLIQELANYAHAQDPNFKIWINSGGAEDMLANSALDSTIQGAYEEQLFYQTPTQATDKADLNYNLAYMQDLVKAGGQVVAVEYVSGASEVASVEAQAKADGLGYYIANPNQALDGVDTQGFTSGSTSTGTTPTAAPTVKITSAGGTTSSAAQTIAGTVDVADAGSTVKILDGTTQIGSATVAANGNWSAPVTLSKQGANVLTATDTNAAGTGTSNAVTFTLANVAPTAPTLAIADTTLSVTGGGGSVNLGISVTAPSSSTKTTVTITGLPQYERITDNLDGQVFRGTSVTLSEAEVDSGLTLTSRYRGTGHPVATLTVTARDTIGGVTSASAPQTITVKDPPASASGYDAHASAGELLPFEPTTGLGFDWNGAGVGQDHFAPANADLASILENAQNAGAFSTALHHADDHSFRGPDIAVSHALG